MVSLVTKFKAVETGELIGHSVASEGGFWVSGVLNSESLTGVPAGSMSAQWRLWSGCEVEALIVHTESSPSDVRWKSWYLTIDLAVELFGEEHV